MGVVVVVVLFRSKFVLRDEAGDRLYCGIFQSDGEVEARIKNNENEGTKKYFLMRVGCSVDGCGGYIFVRHDGKLFFSAGFVVLDEAGRSIAPGLI